jgi:SAM-dependent methyltransferase
MTAYAGEMSGRSDNWREIDKIPAGRPVREHLARVLLSKRRGLIDAPFEFLKRFVTGRRVLDIGVAEHDAARMERADFKHGIIARHASYALGIDILADDVERMKKAGFNVRVADGTSEEDLGDRFDRVVLGDVIEHVDNPVALLKFAGRHLADGGQILCATPNPFFIVTLAQGLRDGVFVANAEHVSWITPTMALELAHRSGLRLDEYWHTQGEGKTVLRRAAVLGLKALGLREAELFSGCFYYVFGRRPAE